MGFILLPFILSEYGSKGKAGAPQKSPWARCAAGASDNLTRVLKNKHQAVSQGV